MRWTETEIMLVRELYPDLPSEDVAALLGRKVGTVHQCAARYGIVKSDYFKEQNTSGRIQRGKQDPRMKAGQFKPGHTTWNAGRKGWQAGGRSAETQFAPGDLPPNTLPIGSYRVLTNKNGKKHLEQKMREVPGSACKRWTPVSRIVWEAVHGPVPKGSIVVFSPGKNTIVLEEITIDKLECITRAEHANRNHPRSRFPEMGSLYQLKGAITRQINRINRENKNEHTQHPQHCPGQ